METSKQVFCADKRIALAGIAVSILFWLYESVLHAYLFNGGGIRGDYFFPSGDELWMRSVIVTVIIASALYIQFALNRLRHAQLKLKNYMDTAGVIYVVLDKDGRVGFINRFGSEMLGYAEEEIKGKDWFSNFLPVEIRDEVRGVFLKLKSGRLDPLEYYENPVLTKDGGQRIISWHNSILKDRRGGFIGTLSAGMDITEKRKMEEDKMERLEELERFRRATVAREFRIRELRDEVLSLRKKAGVDGMDP